jgi:DNA/RNA endonuclease G (NUC1)
MNRRLLRPLGLFGTGLTAGCSCDLNRYGFPWRDTVVCDHGHFKVCWCARTRNPKWVLEKLNQQTIKGPGSREKAKFHEDRLIEARFRSHPRDFKHSGFDRGHLAPAADFHCSQQAIEDTFIMSNISPQVGIGFNRDYWSRFENFVRSLTSHPQCQDVFVVTGPLFLPRLKAGGQSWEMQHQLLGSAPELVAVPTHFFKVVLMELSSGARPVAAFVMPNDKIDPNTPLTNFVVPIESLECAAGMAFFPGFLTDQRRTRADKGAVQWMTGRKSLGGLPPKKQLGDGKGVALGVSNCHACHICDVVKCALPSSRRK